MGEEREKTELEKQMEQLLKGSTEVMETAKAVKGTAGKVRRKSKDLVDDLGAHIDAVSSGTGGGGRRSRRGSRDYTEDQLKKAFEAVDLNGNGVIEKHELEQVICAFSPVLH